MSSKRAKRGPIRLSKAPQPQTELPFLSKALETEFLRWCNRLGKEAELIDGTVDSRTVLRAHFLVAEYFLGPGRGMAAVGPSSVQLLQSAVSRQFVAFEGHQKWTDPFDIAATLFFGLAKNHTFHDANKRTALLTALFQPQAHGRLPIARQEEFERLTLRVAEGTLDEYPEFHQLASTDDADVRFIGWFFRRHTRLENKREHFLSFKQLGRVLSVDVGDGGNPSSSDEEKVRVTWSRATLPVGSAHEDGP